MINHYNHIHTLTYLNMNICHTMQLDVADRRGSGWSILHLLGSSDTGYPRPRL